MDFLSIDAIRIVNLPIMFTDPNENSSSFLEKMSCPIADITKSLDINMIIVILNTEMINKTFIFLILFLNMMNYFNDKCLSFESSCKIMLGSDAFIR